jgi:hypothetical protein
MHTVLPKDEIYRRVDAMRKNRRKGFSMKMFAEFACMNYRHFEAVLRDRKDTFTESSQRKVSKALLALEKGEAGPRMDILGKRFIGYHPTPKPVNRRSMRIQKTRDGFKIAIRLQNKYSISTKRLDD